ncbi:MAG: sensor domain-containing diguanylate cyclase [Hydrogenovibrio sp.]
MDQKIIELISSSDTVVFYCDYAPKWPLRFATRNMADFGYDSEAVCRETVCFKDLVHTKDVAALENAVAEQIEEDGFCVAKTIRLKVPDSSGFVWVETRLSFERNAEGEVTNLLGKLVDVTERVAAEERLKIFAKVVAQTADFVKITDREGRLVFVNQALLDKTGYTEKELLGRTLGVFKSEMQDQTKAKALWQRILAGEVYHNRIMNRCKDGSTYYEDITISPVFGADEAIEYFVSTGKDVSEQVKMQQALNEMAMKDALTGLCNRRHLMSVIEQEMAERQACGQVIGMILFDVDFFKEINDRYGHDVGDEVLLEMAEILKHLGEGINHVGRWGGEEFLLLVLEPDLGEMIKTANGLREQIQQHSFSKIDRVTVSIGVTLSNVNDTPADLFKRADQALYKAKHNGRNRVEIS